MRPAPPQPRKTKFMQLGVIAATVAVTFLVVFLAFASTAAVNPHDPSRVARGAAATTRPILRLVERVTGDRNESATPGRCVRPPNSAGL